MLCLEILIFKISYTIRLYRSCNIVRTDLWWEGSIAKTAVPKKIRKPAEPPSCSAIRTRPVKKYSLHCLEQKSAPAMCHFYRGSLASNGQPLGWKTSDPCVSPNLSSITFLVNGIFYAAVRLSPITVLFVVIVRRLWQQRGAGQGWLVGRNQSRRLRSAKDYYYCLFVLVLIPTPLVVILPVEERERKKPINFFALQSAW